MAWSRQFQEGEPQRVNKWLAQNGVCSRREAEALIASGRVSIDGETVADVGRKIARGQTLVLSDDPAAKPDVKFTAVYHKPVGVVSGQPEPGQTPAVRLLTASALYGTSPFIPHRETMLAPAGRLDMDSRGLLVLTADGVVAKAIIGPSSQLDKEYRVLIDGRLDSRKIALLRHGLHLDGRALKAAEVEAEGDNWLRIILREGRNRQIRRMCSLLDLRVVDLFRVRIGPLELGDLPEARWRPLKACERVGLIRMAQGA